MPSIDWLTVYQRHLDLPEIPELGSDLIITLDHQTQELKRRVLHGYNHKGSYDTNLRIRSVDNIIEVSGNPSGFNREDNLFGLPTIRDAITAYNRLLDGLGLPRFTRMATITRVDLARNFTTGNMRNAYQVIRCLSAKGVRGKLAYLYSDGTTVDWWKGNKGKYLKYYLKGPEFNRHHKERSNYQNQLLDWMTTHGVMRQEITLRSRELAKRGLRHPERWTLETPVNLLEEFSMHNLTEHRTNYETIAEQLIAQGEKEATAERAQQLALSWLAGYDLRPSEQGGRLTRRTYYRYKRVLAQVGIDISSPCEVTRLLPKVETIYIEPAVPPAWYKWAS